MMHLNNAVVFDLDGVLFDTEPLHFRAYSTLLSQYGIQLDVAAYIEHWIGRGDGIDYAIKALKLPLSHMDARLKKDNIYERLIANPPSAFAGAKATLEMLHGAFPMAIATGSRRMDAEHLLRHAGLIDFFSCIISRSDFERSKPAPDAYQAACNKLGVRPNRCVVVEDSMKGVCAARSAGCLCISIPNDMSRIGDYSQAHCIVSSLVDVTPDLIRELLSGPSMDGR